MAGVAMTLPPSIDNGEAESYEDILAGSLLANLPKRGI